MRRKQPDVASPWLRLGAAMIDVAIFLPLIGLAVFGWFKLGRPARDDPPRPPGTSQRFRRIAAALTAGSTISLRNSRSPGSRLLGLRRVDARTGGAVTVRSAVIHQMINQFYSAASRELVRPDEERRSKQLRELEPAMREIRRQHADDADAMNAGIRRLYIEHDVNPFRACLWPLLLGIVVQLPAFWTPDQQALADWLAGTIVIRD